MPGVDMMRLTLNRKISLLIVVTVVIVLAIGFYFIIENERKDVLKGMRRDAVLLTDVVHHEVDHVLNSIALRNETLQLLTEQVQGFEGLLYVEIFNEDAIIIAHSNIERVGGTPTSKHVKFVKRVFNDKALIEEKKHDEGKFNLFVPVLTGNGKREKVSGVIEVVTKMSMDEEASREQALVIATLFQSIVSSIIEESISLHSNLQELVINFADYEEIDYVEIFDKDVIIIAHSDRERIGGSPKPKHQDFIKRVLDDGEAIEEEERAQGGFNRFVPIFSVNGEGKKISGVIELTMNMEPYLNKLHYLRRNLITTAVILMAAIFVILFLVIKRFILSPLKILSDTTQEIASGNLESKLNLNTGDELGDLAKSFNSMSKDLEKSKKKMVDEIVERKMTEKALRESKQMLEHTFASLHDTLFIVNAETFEVMNCNPAASKMFGYALDDIIGQTINLFHRDDETFRKFKEILFKEGALIDCEFSMKHKNGTVLITEHSVMPIVDAAGGRVAWISVVRDITEKKGMEKERLKMQKLESLGVLAGGIAHDFNNLLTGILGNISLIKHLVNPEDKIYKIVLESEKASLYAGELTKQLLTFAKGGEPVKETVFVEKLIKESCDFALRGTNIKSDYIIAEDLLPVDVDRGQVSQVINNLMINATQVMSAGGTIKVSATNITVDANRELPLNAGKYLLISVEDRGGGIPEELLPKIFDPYFTTKEKGSGLGLASAYSIIKKHGGHFEVESEAGLGATFHIYLPASNKELTLPNTEEPMIKGSGRVLIMDDEKMIRELADEYLKHLGYDCVVANDGREAIEVYKKAQESGAPINAVIMDLTIKGGMGGEEAIKLFLEVDSDARVIVSSGYSVDPIMADYKKYGFSGVIAKPYTIAKLSEVIDNVLKGEK